MIYKQTIEKDKVNHQTVLSPEPEIMDTLQSQNKLMKINLKDLEGKWYINQSNFPMWLKGDKTSPTFNYTMITKNNQQRLLDKVEFEKDKTKKSIVGFDTALNQDNTKFVWRGKGILALLSSKWEILHLNSTENWAIIYFEKTMLTPKGYDVISRHNILNKDIEQQIQMKLTELGITERLTPITQQ